MTQSQAVALIQDWQLWDGRIVNGKYPLRECLGENDGVAAYLTEINGSIAVIKLLAADAANARAQVASWKLAARLSHPNLVRVLDTGLWHADDEHDVQFAVMEHCEESLDAVLRQRALTADDARQLLVPALEALKYLHHQGILHGLLSPANILASGDQLKLSIDHLRRCTDAASTSIAGAYDAPEKATGTTSLSSDIWALGATLHEALTRRPPARKKDGTAEIPDKLPTPFDEIVQQCLTSDRERRPSLAAVASLLQRPAPVLVMDKSVPADTSAAAAAEIRMLRPESSTPEPEIQESDRSWLKLIEKRPAMIAAVALVLLAAILFGVRRGNDNKAASSSTSPAVAQKSLLPPQAAAPVSSGSSQRPSDASGSVLHQALPEIPERVRNTINGTVKVRVKVAVNAEGKVSHAALSEHGPSAYFARQALEAAQHWTFAPPVHDGKAQASGWMLHFEFRRSGTRATAQHV